MGKAVEFLPYDSHMDSQRTPSIEGSRTQNTVGFLTSVVSHMIP
jgi:hypothetical protein